MKSIPPLKEQCQKLWLLTVASLEDIFSKWTLWSYDFKGKQNKTVHVATHKICILGQTENWENLDLVSDLDSFLILKDFSDKIEVGIKEGDFFFSYCEW